MAKNSSGLYLVKRIRRDMTLKGWVATDLAERTGLSDATIHLFLTGKRQNPRTAKKIADALGRPMSRYCRAA